MCSLKKPSMDDPYLYHINNNCQMGIASKLIPIYINLMDIKEKEFLTVIDIGCATGATTWNYLRTQLPKGTKIVCADIEPKMLEYAKKHYPEMEYIQMDIAALEISEFMFNSYDHVFSFFCLQFVRDQKQALENIYNMLKYGGSFFIYYPCTHPFLDIYRKSLELEKWKNYFSEDLKNENPYSIHIVNLHPFERERHMKYILNKVGFKIVCCKSVPQQYTYKNMQELRDGLTAVHPYYNKIPHKLQTKYMDDVMEEIKKHKDINFKTEDIVINYFLLVIVATKPFHNGKEN